eukprot:1687014-Rhodomonas_salina.1
MRPGTDVACMALYRAYARARRCPVLTCRMWCDVGFVAGAGAGGSTRRQHQSRVSGAVHSEIKYKKLHSWYNLYGNCGFLFWISGCRRRKCSASSRMLGADDAHDTLRCLVLKGVMLVADDMVLVVVKPIVWGPWEGDDFHCHAASQAGIRRNRGEKPLSNAGCGVSGPGFVCVILGSDACILWA